MLIYFTSGTSGEPKMVAHDYLYAMGHLTTGVFWHNLSEDSIHLTVADTGWGKAVWGKFYGQWLAGATVFVYHHEKFFAAVFGTPIAGFLFSLEILCRQYNAPDREIPYHFVLCSTDNIPFYDT